MDPELTQAEIRIGMGGLTRAVERSGLRAWWKFDEAEATIDRFEARRTTFDVAVGFSLGSLALGAHARSRTGAPDDGPGRPPSRTLSMAALTMTEGLTLEAWIHPRDDEPGVIFHKAGEY
ncbi:MAG: hypothetical protein R3F21_21315 [Myxococcota bacterium]